MRRLYGKGLIWRAMVLGGQAISDVLAVVAFGALGGCAVPYQPQPTPYEMAMLAANMACHKRGLTEGTYPYGKCYLEQMQELAPVAMMEPMPAPHPVTLNCASDGFGGTSCVGY